MGLCLEEPLWTSHVPTKLFGGWERKPSSTSSKARNNSGVEETELSALLLFEGMRMRTLQ